MGVYTLVRTQTLSGSIESVWSFFSDPRNLSKITPPSMSFEVLNDLPEKMYNGLMIQYRVSPLAGIPLRWVTEITHLSEHEYFVDEQRIGPYSLWHHEHHFKVLSPGEVEMTDRITYSPPFAFIGDILHPFIIRPKLDEIFDYRTKIASDIF